MLASRIFHFVFMCALSVDPFQVATTRDGQYTFRSLPKHLISQYSDFCYEKKGRGERCVLCVSQPAVELWWGYNGSVIHQGKENCIEFQLSDRTAGIYLCFDMSTHRLLLVHIVFIKEEGGKLHACVLQYTVNYRVSTSHC